MKTVRSGEKGFKAFIEGLARRGAADSLEVEGPVREILADIRHRGDRALVEYTEKFDGIRIKPSGVPVSRREVEKAYRAVPRRILDLLEKAVARIRDFHRRQKTESWFSSEGEGTLMGQLVTPLGRVGLYVPGGKASYPSSVLMNAIPAQVAGVGALAVCTPAPGGHLNPYVLVACDMLGIDEVYRVGGAQAVGALAYGTGTIPRVDKIVGPGNIYVATAKQLVYGEVDIDMIAGPSEILVIADDTADPEFIAADLLSQAEHDEMAVCLLVTDSAKLAEKVSVAVQRRIDELPRGPGERARAAIAGQGAVIVVRSIPEAIRISNLLAPEHLEVITADPLANLTRIRNAGSIFLGPYTPEPLGDYLAGPNHVLPTGGTARFFSTLGVDSFVKRSNVLYFSEKDSARLGGDVARFARLEGLEAHARSMSVRKKK
jgi:histidinol dehydrogenase